MYIFVFKAFFIFPLLFDIYNKDLKSEEISDVNIWETESHARI